MGLGEDRANLQTASEALTDAIANLQSVAGYLETASQSANAAIGDLDNQELLTASGQIVQTELAVSDCTLQALAAKQAIDDYIRRIS